MVEKDVLARLEDKKISYKAGERIREKGSGFEDIYIISEGWTYVSATHDKSIRTIFDFRIDGDFVGVGELSFDKHLYDFYALTNTTVCPFPKAHLDEMFETSPKLRNIFFLILSREQAITNERLISLGRRTAIERIAHFICEISIRFDVIGGSMKKETEFPLRQIHIADMLGLSSVHVSKAMSKLKESGFIDYSLNKMRILDEKKLLSLSGFNPAFLLPPVKKSKYTDAET